MFLIFETGNTSTTIVIRNDNEVKNSYKILDRNVNGVNDLTEVIEQLLSINNINISDIEEVIISSVVRKIKDLEIEFCKKNNLRFFDISSDDIKLNFVKEQKDTGSDLIANVFYAIEEYKENIIIIDMGTATTFMIIEKEIVGAIIVAGFKTMSQTLINNCDLLQDFDFKEPKTILAKNTKDALNVGNYFANVSIINGILERIEKELNKKMKIIITGGYSNLIIDKINFDIKYIPDLTTEGIFKIYKYNKIQ